MNQPGVSTVKRNQRAAMACMWNAGRRELLDRIEAGTVQPPDTPDGWLVSRHTDIRPAYNTQARLRKRYPDLVFKVRNAQDTDDPWSGEIWCKLIPMDKD